jgi:hypothetical protein
MTSNSQSDPNADNADDGSPPVSAHNPENTQTITETKKNSASKEGKDWWDKANIVVTALSTFVIAIATVATVCVTIHHAKIFSEQLAEFKIQATASKDSAEIARETLIAANRPWLSVTLEASTDLVVKDANEVRLGVDFLLKNTGHSPALNADVTAELVPFMSGGGRVAFNDMKEICERVRNAPQGKNLIGHTIFPTDPPFRWRCILVIGREKLDSLWRDFKEVDKPKDSPVFFPVVAGCVSYRSPLVKENLVTEFYAEVRRSDPSRAAFGFDWSESRFPLNQLQLMKSFVGGNAN